MDLQYYMWKIDETYLTEISKYLAGCITLWEKLRSPNFGLDFLSEIPGLFHHTLVGLFGLRWPGWSSWSIKPTQVWEYLQLFNPLFLDLQLLLFRRDVLLSQ
jgi:hypothetical protein